MRGSEAQGSSYLPLAAADIDAMPKAASLRRKAANASPRRWPLLITFLLWLAAALLTLLVARSYSALPSVLNIHQACRMSRMYPSYVLHHPPSPSGLGNKYSLYLYREDNPLAPDEPPTQRRRPAVFLPGNAGSYGQIRSLASWARHDFEERRARGSGGAEANVWETDWWTLDFNEDFSALHSPTLESQALYLNEVLSYLVSYYQDEHMDSIPLLAHSMGGIVARLATRLPTASPYIKTIVTLSTPHAAPPAPIEGALDAIYSRIDSPHPRGAETSLVSLSGGLLDTQLPSELALVSRNANLTTLQGFTSDLPGLWSSVDHLAMMWCDQLRRRLAWSMGQEITQGQGASVAQRQARWARALGLRGVARPKLEELVKDAPHVAIAPGDAVRDYPYRSGDEEFQLLTDLALGEDPTLSPGPTPQGRELHVFACVDVAGKPEADCRPLPVWAGEVVPSKSSKADTFPMAEAYYEQPGNAARLLRVSKGEMGQHTSIKVVRTGNQMGFWRAMWVRKDTATPLVQSYDLSRSSSGGGVKHSTYLLYDVTFTSTCRQEPRPEFAPFAHFYSKVSGDGRWMPATSGSSKLHLHLGGEEGEQIQLDLYSDGCNFTDVKLTPQYRASVGLWVARFRWAAYAWTLAPFALVLAMRVRYAETPLPLISLQALVILYGVTIIVSLLAPQHLLGLANDAKLTFLASSGLLLISWSVVVTLAAIVGASAWLVERLPLLPMNRLAFPSSSIGGSALTARKSTLLGLALLCVAVKTVLPYQFVFLGCTVVQIFNVVRAARSRSSPSSSPSSEASHDIRFAQQATLLVHLLLLLPLKAATLVVFARNAIAGYIAPPTSFGGRGGMEFGEDHDLWRILPVLGLVQVCSTGRRFEIGIGIGGESSGAKGGTARRAHRFLSAYALPLLYLWLASIALLRGGSKPYVVYEASMLCFAALLGAHYAGRWAQQQARMGGGGAGVSGVPMELGRTQRARREREEREVEAKLLGRVEEVMPFEVPDGIEEEAQTVAAHDPAPSTPTKEAEANSPPAPATTAASASSTSFTATSPSSHSHLDSLLLTYLTKLDAYQAAQLRLSTHLTSGFLALSKARMGSTRTASGAGTVQWGEQVRRLVDAEKRAELVVDGEGGGLVVREAGGWGSEDEGDEEEVSVQTAGEEKEKREDGLRRRKGKVDVDAEKEDKTSTANGDSDEKKGKPSSPDDDAKPSSRLPPSSLHRFSPLPSPSVRRAHASFMDALQEVGGATGLAAMARELMELEERIREERRRVQAAHE